MSSSSVAHVEGDSSHIDQGVLSRIQHLNLTEKITDRNQSAVAYGGFSEVFRGLLRRDGREPLEVAIKRLRFHVDETKIEKAGQLVLPHVVLADSQQLSSNSPRRSTYGQSYLTQTSYHSWDLLSARKHASP